jgi:hypothetical protein
LKFSIRDSKHDFLYKTLRPLATGLIKKQIQKAIRDALVTGLEYIDGQLVAVRDRMDNAKNTEGGESRTEALMSVSSSLSLITPVRFVAHFFRFSYSSQRKKRREGKLRSEDRNLKRPLTSKSLVTNAIRF